jgi:hypothetical protein
LRYFYAWRPLVLLATVVILTLPWLGVIALIVVLFVTITALRALVRAVVWVISALVRSVPRPSWERVTHTHGLG